MIRWVDGAEMWGDATYMSRAYLTATAVSATTPGRVTPGLRHMLFSTGGTLKTPSLGADNTWTIGFGFKMTSFNVAKVRVFAGSAEQCRLELEDSSGSPRWNLIRGSTTIATSSTFAYDQWVYFELKVDVLTSGATYELRRNEVNIMSGTGANLADTGASGADSFGFTAATAVRLDDIYILDSDNTDGAGNTTFRGDSVEFEAVVTGDGHEQDMAPSTGSSHVGVVDDLSTAASSSDYLSSDTNGDEEYFQFEDLPSTGLGTIYCVKLSASVAMAGTGSRTFKYRFYDSSLAENDVGPTVALSGSQIVELPVYVAINPDTATAWTKVALDGGEFGIQVVS